MSTRTSELRALGLGGVALVLAVGSPALGQSREWTGTYRCAGIEGTRIGPIDQPIRATVEGSTLRFERQFQGQGRDGSQLEQGRGTIAPDGKAEANSTVITSSYRYEARFTGTATPTQIRLTGVQKWVVTAGMTGGDRRCSITLAPAS